jgi:hypothetical protein
MLQEEEIEDLETLSLLLTTLIKNEAPLRLKHYVDRVVPGYTDIEFQENFRMSREAFEKLLIIVIQRMDEPRAKKYSSVKKDLLATIWVLANPEALRY